MAVTEKKGDRLSRSRISSRLMMRMRKKGAKIAPRHIRRQTSPSMMLKRLMICAMAPAPLNHGCSQRSICQTIDDPKKEGLRRDTSYCTRIRFTMIYSTSRFSQAKRPGQREGEDCTVVVQSILRRLAAAYLGRQVARQRRQRTPRRAQTKPPVSRYTVPPAEHFKRSNRKAPINHLINAPTTSQR